MDSVHALGFIETAVDHFWLTNSWLNNCWKQFWDSSFNFNAIFKYQDNMADKILRPKVDVTIVRPDIQLDLAGMVGHLIYLLTLHSIEVNRPFSFATLLMLCNGVPTSTNLSTLVCPDTRHALERDFRLDWRATWFLLVPLRTSFDFATNLIKDLQNNQLGDFGWTFTNFILQESNLEQQIEDKIGGIIYSHLFNGRLEIGKAMQEGFTLQLSKQTLLFQRSKG